ncbi:hypothetical protein [Clostridium cylindrosporum]|uniref:Uncharacterized protein n=1 Tax=Clostridium cylindrosporum DSM 605 TaxID=1121307 RepID=A0A0J8D6U2_CLOCY|nr:hypothetical protein [Clostridium cylindrosporum]KMT21577.1 hypothetical protein CLCY_2c03390 [Clostridium cylindrosporum DSM 605]
MKVYVVSYKEDGGVKERGFRNIVDAEKLKKIKKGDIRPIEVEIKPVIRV